MDYPKKKIKCEIWKPVKGFEGFYEVSTYGNVRSCDRTVFVHKSGKEHRATRKGKILKKWVAVEYYHVTFSKDGKIYAPFVHKLVAETFIPNPNELRTVNHKDENKLNNQVDNLEWCTQVYNRNYGHSEEKRLKSFMRSKESHKTFMKAAVQCDMDGNAIKIYKPISDVEKDGFKYTCVINCCKGKRKSHKGYVWKYANESMQPLI